MSLEIKEITTPKELKTFIRFPHTLYKGNPYWVPPLDFDDMNTLRWDRNPAFEHCQAKYFLALRDGKPVGRIAAIINHLHMEKWGQRYMRFGWVDFIDDHEVSAALFAAVEGWAKQEGLEAVHGPLGFTDLDREGMLVEGFNEVGTMATNYNHPYYPEHLERLGYLKDTDWVEYEITAPDKPNETVAHIAEAALKRSNLHLLNAKNKKEMIAHAGDLFDVLDDAYAPLYGTVPITQKQVDAYVKQYFDFVSPEFVPMVLDANNRMIGFGVTMPSLSKALQKARGSLFPLGWLYLLLALRGGDRADLYLIGVHSDYKGKGVNAIVMNEISKAFIRKGIKKCESNPNLENNSLVQAQWKFFEHRQHKRRRCYIKRLKA